MNYLIVENGIITNIIVADGAFAEKVGALPCYKGARIGDEYAPKPEPTTEELLYAMLGVNRYE